MKMKKILSLALSTVIAGAMFPNAFAADVDIDTLMAEGTAIITPDTLNDTVDGSTVDNPISLGATEGDIYYDDFYYNADGVQYKTSFNYTSPSDAKITLTTESAISEGDICLIAFKSVGLWPQDAQRYQFAITDGTDSTATSEVSIPASFDVSKWDEENKDAAWTVSYVPITATADFDQGSNFEIYLGFNDFQQGYILDLSVVDIGQEYTMKSINDAIGIDTATKQAILSTGSVIVNNNDLLKVADNTFPKTPNAGTANWTEAGKAWNGSGMIIHSDGSIEPTRTEEKVSIPITSAVSAGDVCLFTFDAACYWSQTDSKLGLQFALSDGTNAQVTEEGYYAANIVNDNFAEKYAIAFVADRDYPVESTFDIYLGFQNWQTGFIGDIELRNLKSNYTLDEVQSVYKLISNLSSVAASVVDNKVKVDFKAYAEAAQNIDYAIALYDGNKLVDVQFLQDTATGKIAQPYTYSFENKAYTSAKVMAFNDISSLAPLFASAKSN